MNRGKNERVGVKPWQFFSKFWTVLFIKLGVKLLYSTIYHLQINESSKQTNQTIEIALKFFIHIIEDPSQWPKVLPHIQFLLNNTFPFKIGKTPNKIAYGFSLRRPLDLYLVIALPDTYIACTDIANAIFFALINYKKYHNKNHQFLFMKAGDWAILKFHKKYSILSSIGVTKKLI